MNTFPKGEPLKIIWRFLKNDFTPLNLEDYDLALTISNGRGSFTPDFSTDGCSAWAILDPKRLVATGEYTLTVELSHNGRSILLHTYPGAFGIATKPKRKTQCCEISHECEAGIVSLVSILDVDKMQVGDLYFQIDELRADFAAKMGELEPKVDDLTSLGIAIDTENDILTIGGKQYNLVKGTAEDPDVPGGDEPENPDDNPDQPDVPGGDEPEHPENPDVLKFYRGEVVARKADFTNLTAQELLESAVEKTIEVGKEFEEDYSCTSSCFYLLLPTSVTLMYEKLMEEIVSEVDEWIPHDNIMIGGKEYRVLGYRFAVATETRPLVYRYKIKA